MSDVRLIEAPLEMVYDLVENDPEGYEREFALIEDGEGDAIGQWLKIAKAKGDASESDPVLLHLMVELYRKMDRLERIITNTASKRIALKGEAQISRIGLEHFELDEPLWETGKRYYGRIVLPSLSDREVPVYFEAVSPVLAKITKIRFQDENEWGTYMRSRERALIRAMKGNIR